MKQLCSTKLSYTTLQYIAILAIILEMRCVTDLCVSYAMKTSRKSSYPKKVLLWIKLRWKLLLMMRLNYKDPWKHPLQRENLCTKQYLLNPVFDVRLTINLTNIGISTLYVVFVPMQDILRRRVSLNAGVHSSVDKNPKTKEGILFKS